MSCSWMALKRLDADHVPSAQENPSECANYKLVVHLVVCFILKWYSLKNLASMILGDLLHRNLGHLSLG